MARLPGLILEESSSSGPLAAGQTLTRSLRWIPEQARRLAAEGAVSGKTWSLAEVCEHLALALESTVRGTGDARAPRRWRALGRFERVKRWCIKQAMLVTGWFPQGVSAPDSVAPSGCLPIEDTLNRLRTASADFDRKLSSPGATWGYHSLLGKMNGRSWRRFHSIHAAHHFRYFTTDSRS